MDLILYIGIALIVSTFFKVIKRAVKLVLFVVAVGLLVFYFSSNSNLFDQVFGSILQVIGGVLI